MNYFKYLLSIILFCQSLYTVNAQITELEIWEIQGEGLSSPFEDSTITAKRNIVTLVTNDRFFIQTPLERSDNNALTSDGIMIFVGDPVNLEAGDMVTVTGEIQEYFGLTEFGPNNLSYTLDSTGVDLPDAFILDETIPATEIQSLPDIERLEGMRVEFANGVSSGPTNNNLVPFSLQTERPFREPGIAYPGLNGLPVWDNNPEVLQLNLRWAGGGNYASGTVISSTGVLTYDNDQYQVIPEPQSITFDGDLFTQAVRDKETLEATIGSLNCFVFSNTSGDFSARRTKIANYIVEQLKAPDILAVQEVRNLATLEALAEQIQIDHPDIVYDAYLELGNQSGSFQINNGFLVRNTISNVEIEQLAKDEVLSLGGLLHDRPPLLLKGDFTTEPPTPIQVLNLHLRSLGGIEGGNAEFVRTKRWEQSISVANIMRDLQFENLVVVGDFNAFQFSDGYVDVLAQLTGEATLGAEFPVLDIVDFPVTNHSLSVETEEQYSFIFRGNAQILDHCLSNDLEDLSVNEFQYARGNSDNPDNFVDNVFVPYRASDHDGFVLFLGLADTLSVSAEDLPINHLAVEFPNPFPENGVLNIKTDRKAPLHIEMIDQLGRRVFYKKIESPNPNEYISTERQYDEGLYYLKISQSDQSIIEKILIQ